MRLQESLHALDRAVRAATERLVVYFSTDSLVLIAADDWAVGYRTVPCWVLRILDWTGEAT